MTSVPPPNEGASSDKKDLSFPSSLRLKGKKKISELFKNGSFFYLGPYKILYTINQKALTPQMEVLISIPKSRIQKASSRNKAKRKIKEAFRLNKDILFSEFDALNLIFDKLGIIYQKKEVLPYNELENKLKHTLKRLSLILQKENEEL